MVKPTEQIYANYKAEDFAVWSTLYNRQIGILKEAVSQSYLDALIEVNFTADKIPDFNELNQLFKKNTSWQIEVVPNICPENKFFACIADKVFTSTCWLRTMDQLDYLEEPDMFHDVFGHMPLLSNKNYSNFFTAFGGVALKYIDNPIAIQLLSRIYWYTIEFGLIQESNNLKIYGAGIISSFGETKNAIDDSTNKHPFDIEKIIDSPYRTDIIQDKYFIIDSFEQLYSSIGDIEYFLQQKLA